MKAIKTGFILYGKCSNMVEYEYRGRRYEVEYATDCSYCCTPAHVQHQDRQTEIDRRIEEEQKPKELRHEDTAEYGFELFWSSIEEV